MTARPRYLFDPQRWVVALGVLPYAEVHALSRGLTPTRSDAGKDGATTAHAAAEAVKELWNRPGSAGSRSAI